MAHEEERFEYAGKTFPTKGTSGPAQEQLREASERGPVRGDLTVGGRSMQRAGTSGPHSAPDAAHRIVGGPNRAT